MKLMLHAGLVIASMVLASPAFAEAPKNETKEASPAKEPVKDYVIIKLDGEDIKYSEVINIWKGLFQGSEAPDFATFDENIRQNILRGLLSERLIYREAIKEGVDKKEDVKKRVENLKRQLIMQSFIEEKAKSLVTDAEIKAAYDAEVAESKGQEEVKARHVLLSTEDEAKKIHDEIKKGGDFEKIAKEKSVDKGTAVSGGDLGWFAKDKMVPEFSEAAFKLKKGEISEPVKSPFGWHIIKLDDRRPLQIASLEDSKELLRTELSSKVVQKYVQSLLDSSSVKYFDENGKEKEFSAAPKAEGTKEKVENKK